VHGGWEDGNGAYQEYVKVDKGLIIPLPDNVSFEGGATLPLASITAALVIFQQLGFPFPGEGKKDIPFLVWGGASSVGMYAIQLANLAGATVIATASKQNHDLLKSLGATYTFDYKDVDVIEKIKKASGGGVQYGIDTVSEAKTVQQSLQREWRNWTYPSCRQVQVWGLAHSQKRPNVLEFRELIDIRYSIFNHDFSFGPQNIKANPKDHEFAIKAYKLIADLLANGKMKPNPVKKYPKGLASVEQGFQDAENGKIHAEKVVYKVSDTPS